ncbi:MAG: apolipoprotein N-acyltransferase [Gammaproteobacteria bacterium]|nr:apolipoprotein N-acyltransferase [Gammaproteobacteria bacterium]
MLKLIKNFTHRELLAVLAGALVPLSLSPFNFNLLIYISIILLLYSINNIDKCSIKRAVLRGYLYGCGCFSLGVSWVYISIHDHGNASIALAGLFTLMFVLTLAIFPALKIGLFKYLLTKQHNLNLLILAPSIWIIIDWLQGWVFTGFPWLYIGYSQTNSILANFAPILSVFGLSWLTVFISGLIYLILQNILLFIKNNRNQTCINHALSYLLILVTIFISGQSLSGIQWTTRMPGAQTENLVLVQGNIPQEMRWQKSQLIDHINKYINLSKPYWAHSTIIWPESAVPLPAHYIKDLIEEWLILAKKNNSTLIFGVPILANNNDQFYNAIVAINNKNNKNNKNTKIDQYYKNKLVPWGEYVPLENIFRGLIEFFDLPMSNFISGTAGNIPYSVLHSEFIQWLPFICYEIAYPDYVISQSSLGNAIITISNDAWFGHSIGPWQHLQLAQMRALETGRPVIRSTNNGITAIIGADGKIIKQIPQFETAILTGKITGYTGMTPIMYIGVKTIITISFLLILLCYRLDILTSLKRR